MVLETYGQADPLLLGLWLGKEGGSASWQEYVVEQNCPLHGQGAKKKKAGSLVMSPAIQRSPTRPPTFKICFHCLPIAPSWGPILSHVVLGVRLKIQIMWCVKINCPLKDSTCFFQASHAVLVPWLLLFRKSGFPFDITVSHKIHNSSLSTELSWYPDKGVYLASGCLNKKANLVSCWDWSSPGIECDLRLGRTEEAICDVCKAWCSDSLTNWRAQPQSH